MLSFQIKDMEFTGKSKVKACLLAAMNDTTDLRMRDTLSYNSVTTSADDEVEP
jgi:hypothetical protein